MPNLSSQRTTIQCPHCGSGQFVTRQKATAKRWVFYLSAFAVGLFSIFLGSLTIFIGPVGLLGFVTLLFIPVLSLIGFYGCRKIVNTCSNCKRDF
jgi:DNA-directed RNA polymerase subunit RPC12/RpoP